MSETPAPAEQPQAMTTPDMERTRHVEQLRGEVNRLKFDTSVKKFLNGTLTQAQARI